MGIFDVFTGKSAKEAAEKNAQLYNQYGQTATAALNNGLGSGLGALDQGLTRSTDALTTNANRAYATLGTGLGSQIGALDSGLAQQRGAYDQALATYTPLAALGSKYGGATSLLLDALGTNGAEGNARAAAAFQASPGYAFQVDQATDAAARKAAALGMAASGNTLDAVRNTAQNIANAQYGDWRNALTGFVNPELQATSAAAQGRAGIYGNLANAYGTDAAARAGAYGNTASAGANLWNGLGQTLAGAYGTDANTRANLYGNSAQNIANVQGNVASGQANSNTAAAQAAQQGSAQFWNSLINLGAAAAKAKSA